MSAEVIRNIRQAEQQAENIRQEAMLKAREILAQAEEQGRDILERETQDAKKEGAKLIESERARTEEEVGRLNEESDVRCEQMTFQARAKKDEAASYIMERIVKSYGDN